MNEIIEKQKIYLKGAHNVRDLGGFKCGDSCTSKWGRFVRADGLENLTDEDIKKISDYGVKIDIDLRSDEEIGRWKDNLKGVKEIEYFNVSLLKGVTGLPETLGELYIHTLKKCKKQFYKVFKIMIENEDKGVLFHCSAGKDRTGMIAALLLQLIGVDREEIIKNYALTAENLASVIDKFSEENDESLKKFLGCEEVNMEEFLDYLMSKYNGAVGYLESIGFTKGEIEVLKSSFIEK